MSDTSQQPQQAPLQATPAHATGTAAGLAAATAVLADAVFHYFTGHTVSLGVMGAETTILTYLYGTYLHVPTA